MTSSDPILEQPERDEILDAAVLRAGSTTEKDRQLKEVHATRQEIGRDTYDTAVRMLPAIEYTIRKEFAPFVAQVQAIAQKANNADPQVRRWLQEIQSSCESAPRSLREGIRAYDGLSFASIVSIDGRSVDENNRKQTIAAIRTLLTSHDGVLSFMRSQKGQLKHFIKQNNWPR